MIVYLFNVRSLLSLVIGLIIGATILYWFLKIRYNREIIALGGRAPVVPTKYPLGVDYIYQLVKFAKADRILDFWQWVWESSGAAEKGSFTAEVSLGLGRSVLTGDPDNIKALLGPTQFTDFGKGEKWQENFGEFLGNSIFTVDGEPWHGLRQLLRPIFNKERVGDLKTFEKHVQKLIPLLGSGDGSEVNIRELFVRFSMDVALDFILGTDIDSIHKPDGEFAESWNEVQQTQALILRAGPLKHFIPKKRFRQGIKTIDGLIQPFIEQTLKINPTDLEAKYSQSETFLHQCARYTRDPAVIRDQLLTILLAGRDTTAATLSWIFYELSRNPRVVERLREEIRNHVGLDPERIPMYDDIKGMKYLTHVIDETLRLYPIVPYNMRESLKPTTLPRGGGPEGRSPIGIAKGTVIIFSTLTMQRRRDLYPPVSDKFPDPLEWAPERWEHWTPKAWHFIPFSGGPRICLGQQFALLEIGYTVCRILQHFSRLDAKVDVGTKTAEVMNAELVLIPHTQVSIGLYKE